MNEFYRRLAALSAGRLHDGGVAPPIARTPLDGEVPLTFFQEARWARLRGNPGDTYFMDGAAIRLRGPLDDHALERAIAALVERHGILRMVVRLDRPVAEIRPPGVVTLERHDLGRVTDAAWQATALELIRRPIDLTAGPLFRVHLLRTGDDEHVLLLAFHNLLLNATPIGMLQGDLAALYAAFVSGAAPSLGPTPPQFADFARWQRGWLTPEVVRPRLERWAARLADCVPLTLPTDRPRAGAARGPLAHVSEPIPHALVERVLAASRAVGVTPFVLSLSALAALLHHRTGATKLALRSIANAVIKLSFQTPGMFASLIVVPCDLSGDPPLSAIVEQLSNNLLDAVEDHGLPVWDTLPPALVDTLDLLIDPAPPAAGPTSWAGLTAERVPMPVVDEQQARYDLEWMLMFGADVGHTVTFYDAALFDRDTIARFDSQFRDVLTAMVDQPGRPLSSVRAIATAGERQG